MQVSNFLVRLNLLKSESLVFNGVVEAAVKEFQQARGLSVTGVVDAVTLRSLDEARWKLGDRVLSLSTPYMRGDDVANLQAQLSEMGFNCGRVDGIYAYDTEIAVMDFQKSVGVKADGRCGPATIMAMMRLKKIVSGGAPTQLRDAAARAERGPALSGKVIVIDPSDSPEIFDLTQRLEGRLIALGVNVFLTRTTTSHPTETERIEIANSAGAILLFLSTKIPISTKQLMGLQRITTEVTLMECTQLSVNALQPLPNVKYVLAPICSTVEFMQKHGIYFA